MRSTILLFLFAIALSLSLGCNRSDTKTLTSSDSGVAKINDLATRGRQVYLSSCISCHHSDPSKPGVLGPEIAGSSLELLTARVLRAEYPPGYKPKRGTHQMAAIPQLKDDLPALHAFLNSGK